MAGDDHMQALRAGFQLGSYHVLRVLGAGGFGVTYLCEHAGLGIRVAVKEYLPNEIAVRVRAVVRPKSAADRDSFDWGLSRFLEEARTLARFEHPNVVRVRDCFEANSTAYIVMDYEEGEALDTLLARHGTLTEVQLKRVVLPVAEGLREVHAASFLHRDVKPSNIFVRRADETPVLLDFGSARQALGRRSRSMTAIASAGYSPPELYEREGDQGPWTDIYALCALCYRAITGSVPVEAPHRQSRLLRTERDPLPPLALSVHDYSREFLEAVDWGLRVIETERPQSVGDWLARMAVPLPLTLSPKMVARRSGGTGTLHRLMAPIRRWRHRWRTRYTIAAGVLGTLMVVIGIALFVHKELVPKSGDRFRDCPECPEMVVYLGGSLIWMDQKNEGRGVPMYKGRIAAPFALGAYEITVAEFRRFVEETGYSAGDSCFTYERGKWEMRTGRSWRNPGFGQGQQHPVTCVGWSDAQAFVSWLSWKTGEEYRLPSEAEWETVARIGVEWKCTHANAADASLKERYLDWPWPVASCRDGYVHTAPVGSFSPGGRIGLDDMQGNVWEWAADCWNASHEGAPSDGSAWEDGDCSRRVLRGGSWTNGPRPWTVTLRNMDLIGIRVSTYGFRVARTLEQ